MEVRKHELIAAVDVLGGKLHMLGFRDSGYVGDPANEHPDAFINIDEILTTGRVVELIRELQPQVVITHDETGGYFHPDHIHCWKITTAAFFAAGDPDLYPGKGPAPYKPQRLYYSAFPNRMVWLFTTILRLRGKDPTRMGRNKDIDFTKLGIPHNKLHARINYRQYWDLKRMASAKHQSQGGGTSNSRELPEWIQQRFLASEYFIRAYPQPVEGQVDLDLFAGIVPNT